MARLGITPGIPVLQGWFRLDCDAAVNEADAHIVDIQKMDAAHIWTEQARYPRSRGDPNPLQVRKHISVYMGKGHQ